MFKEFREFIARGNVVDLGVGVAIGGAFSNLINSLINNVVTPPIRLAIHSAQTAATDAAGKRRQRRRIRRQRGADGFGRLWRAIKLVFADGAGHFRRRENFQCALSSASPRARAAESKTNRKKICRCQVAQNERIIELGTGRRAAKAGRA